MNTLLLSGQHTNDIKTAGELLRRGDVVGIPTETVYGLAAAATDPEAVKKIFAAKGRPADNPLIVHIAELSQWAPLVRKIPKQALRLAERFWPGPLTIILEKSDLVPVETSGGLSTVGVRFPSHPVAQAVIRAAGVPLAAPSANRSGRPSPTTFSHLCEDMMGRVAALVDGGDCSVGVESTVITLAGERPRLLRPGGVTLSQLESVLGAVDVDPAVLDRLQEGAQAASPGMKYKHYAPRAQVTLVDASPEEYSSYVNQQNDCHGGEAEPNGCYALCFDEDIPLLKLPCFSVGSRYDGEKQAHLLFSTLLRLDERDAKQVYAHMPSKRGVGLAVYNRMIRAAGFSVVNPWRHFVVGLTGPSGAGKSTAAAVLREAGWAVIDCDALTRSEAVYDSGCLYELQQAFGKDIVTAAGLDRRALAQRAFATPESKRRLEEITFPKILSAVRREIAAAFSAGKRVVALDAPTLFEAGLDDACARILVLTARSEERIARICARDGISEEQARQRLSAQHSEEFFAGRADWVIENPAGCDLSAALAPVIGELQIENGDTAL
ncbi:L-threonylcarbamoyladenylate synthase [uncultured Neglectibacter sp.]|uniref:L-threonylcarbamoyladenylate synthase n=1 Tax=uncultured Neglectibacter sp. TaxID=1924108 RepID=UPI0034DDEF5D